MSSASPSYDVLLLESHPHTADQASTELAAAGHRVHRCYDDPRAFSCVAVAEDGRCPIDDRIDVAVLVRRPLEPRPTHREGGVVCARRAGVPMVEQGPAHPDPWDEWVTTRVDPDSAELVLATEGVARAVDAPAVSAIQRLVTPLVRAAGMDEHAVRCHIERTGTDLAVHVSLPAPANRRVRSAIGVRVLDGLRVASTNTIGSVGVYVHPSLEPSES